MCPWYVFMIYRDTNCFCASEGDANDGVTFRNRKARRVLPAVRLEEHAYVFDQVSSLSVCYGPTARAFNGSCVQSFASLNGQ